MTGIFNTSSNLSTENVYFKTSQSCKLTTVNDNLIIYFKDFKSMKLRTKLTYNLFGPTLKANNRFLIDDSYFWTFYSCIEYVLILHFSKYTFKQ